jgi:hypothetical protein
MVHINIGEVGLTAVPRGRRHPPTISFSTRIFSCGRASQASPVTCAEDCSKAVKAVASTEALQLWRAPAAGPPFALQVARGGKALRLTRRVRRYRSASCTCIAASLSSRPSKEAGGWDTQKVLAPPGAPWLPDAPIPPRKLPRPCPTCAHVPFTALLQATVQRQQRLHLGRVGAPGTAGGHATSAAPAVNVPRATELLESSCSCLPCLQRGQAHPWNTKWSMALRMALNGAFVSSESLEAAPRRRAIKTARQVGRGSKPAAFRQP